MRHQADATNRHSNKALAVHVEPHPKQGTVNFRLSGNLALHRTGTIANQGELLFVMDEDTARELGRILQGLPGR